MADSQFQSVYPALLAVDIGGGKYAMAVSVALPGSLSTPTLYAVAMAGADTEYSQALPANTKKFTIKLRDGTGFRLAFVTGKVATPVDPYFTVDPGLGYSEDGLRLAATTLYFASDVAGKTAEIIAWV